jgi:hypothetical protein
MADRPQDETIATDDEAGAAEPRLAEPAPPTIGVAPETLPPAPPGEAPPAVPPAAEPAAGPEPPAPRPGGDRVSRRTLALVAVALVVVAALAAAYALAPRGPDEDGPPTLTPTVPTTAAPWPAGAILVSAADSPAAEVERAAHHCDGTDDQVEIQRALDEAGANGGTVALLDGTFHCTDKINPKAGTTLVGLGADRTVLDVTGYYKPIELLQDGVTLRDFRVENRGFVLVRASHVLVEDITISTMHSGKVEANGAFFVFAKDSVVQDVEFRNCTAVDCGIHGFNVNGDGSPKETRDLRYIDCTAIRCGNADSNAVWATGFDFHETNDLYGITVLRCRAEDNWESGFHFEPGGHVTPKTVAEDIRMEDCVSIGNGQRNTKGYPYTDTFQSGYYVHNNAVLVNCTSEKNRNAGFFVHGGRNVTFEDCTDTGSTYGWKVVKDSHDVTLKECATSGNLEWGFWGADAERVTLEGFEQRGVTGKDGYQSMLGWYYGNPDYAKPVTDSHFEIAADGTLPAINQAGEGNTYDLTTL